MTIDLKVLADEKNRDALLLAEVAALLHDMGKLSSQFIDQMSWQPSAISGGFEHENAIEKIDGFVDAQFVSALKSTKLRNLLRPNSIPKQEQLGQILDLILHHDKAKHSAFLVRLLNRCDGTDSGADKGTTRDQGLPKEAKQSLDNTLIASAFGKESPEVRIDTARIDTTRRKLSQKVGRRLDAFFGNPKQERSRILRLINVAYRCGLGETRRSANDVTLWDHSFSVATLYKSSLATFLLRNSLDIDHLCWRLLRVNFDVLGLYAKAIKIGDLLGYKRAVERACEAVKKLVEEEYPLGNEIYRDSSGIYFTFPDLDLPADLAQEIRRRVEEVEMELAPRIAVTVGDGNTATEQLKSILGKARREALNALAQPFDSQNLSADWQKQWETVGQGRWEVCPVCGLRPKREDREVCAVCENRRTGRLSEWLKALKESTQPQPTIWTNEVADKNGRLALLVGKFDLEDWLSGDLVQTMLVKVEQNNSAGCTPKNPSPARLRRIWETTQRFWETALDEKDSKGNPFLPAVPCRLLLSGKLQKEPRAPALAEQPICELLVQGFKLSVVWHGGRFIVCDNPAYFQETTSQSLEEVLQPGSSFPLFTSEGYKKQDQKIGAFIIEKVERSTSYLPFIPILAEPQIFMALVPADRALEVVKAIKEKYEREMGKVQNRLPLHLGVVYAGRRTPLAALLDAGRRMLRRPVQEVRAEVETVTPPIVTDAAWPAVREVTLRVGERQITVAVPTVMGDGTTPDHWYPYWQVADKPTDRARWFTGTDGEHWVHVCDLRAGDAVAFTPSTFDFEYLDTTARRFEVSYDGGHRRGRDKRQRPYLLGEIEQIEWAWAMVGPLPTTQIKTLVSLIETKRMDWGQPTGDLALALPADAPFRQLCRDALATTAWRGNGWKDFSDADQGLLERAALSGMLRDALEIHLEIMKEELKKEDQHEQ